MGALLEASDLSISIGATRICSGLNLTIRRGQSWALVGQNGAGKTTLLHYLAGLRTGHAGQIRLCGQPIDTWPARERARRLAVLLQHSSRGFGASVLETVLSGRHPHLDALAWEGPDDLAIADDCLAATGLDLFRERSLDTLSGGELRRVEIARLLAQQALLALLDEPFNHLDLSHQAAMLSTLRERCVTPDRAMLMVMHDLNIAWHACDHWLILAGGGSWHAGTRESLAQPDLLSAAFGHPVIRHETDEGPWFRARI